MTDRDFKDQVERIKTAVDGQLVADRLGLRGKGRFFCPACQPNGGKTPDLSVGDRGFHCFKCGRKGDLIQLVQLVQGSDFMNAVAWLARESGQEAPGTPKRRRPGSRSEVAPIVRPGASSEAAVRRCPELSGLFDSFLVGCRPVDGPALAYLTGRGIGAAVVERIGLRFCGREYADLTESLADRFGPDRLLAAGLLKNGRNGPVPTFWPFFAKQIGFLVIPYRLNGQPVYLKVRPPIDKATAEANRVVRFMNTAGTVPCPFNADAIAGADRILVCEGETDTLTALSSGYAAVGIPGWSAFKAEWVGLFAGKTTFLVMDADKAGDRGVRDIARKFDRAGFPLPRQVVLPPGQDLNDFFQRDGRME